jgi:hypothetical protein
MKREHFIADYVWMGVQKKAPMCVMGPALIPPDMSKFQHLKPYTATQILKERAMGQVLFRVPAKEIIAEWTERRDKFQEDLRQEVATIDRIKQASGSADVSCNDGKVHSLRRQIRLLELQLRFIDSEETFIMDENGLQSTFESFAHIGGLGSLTGQVAERPR